MFFTPPNQINLFENVAPANIRWFPCVSNHLCPLWRHNCDRTDRINLLPHSQISTLVDCKWIQNTIPVSIFEWQPNIFIQSTNLATYEQRHGKFDNRMALRSHTTSATEIYYIFNFIIAIAPQSTICGRKYMKYVTETMTFIKIDAGKYECFRRPNDKTYADIVICFSFLISVLSVLLHWLISDKLRCVMLNRRGWDVNQFCSHNFSC